MTLNRKYNDEAAGTVPTALLFCPDTENPDVDSKGIDVIVCENRQNNSFLSTCATPATYG